MKTKILALIIFIFSSLTSVKLWLDDEVSKVRWAIELAGGMSALTSKENHPLFKYDELFIKTLKIKTEQATLKEIEKLTLCTENTDECTTNVLSIANVILINQANFEKPKELIFQYKNLLTTRTEKCEAKYEISRTLLASRQALSLTDEKGKTHAKKTLEQMRTYGGIDSSLDNAACKHYFAENPKIAQAYLAHIAF